MEGIELKEDMSSSEIWITRTGEYTTGELGNPQRI
jgi:hypothetical protein